MPHIRELVADLRRQNTFAMLGGPRDGSFVAFRNPPEHIARDGGRYTLISLIDGRGSHRQGYVWGGVRGARALDPGVAARAFSAGQDADNERKITAWLSKNPTGKPPPRA